MSKELVKTAKASGLHVARLAQSAHNPHVDAILKDSNLLKIGVSRYAGQLSAIETLKARIERKLRTLGKDVTVEDLVALGKVQVECEKIEKDVTDSLVGIVPRALGGGLPDSSKKKIAFPEDGELKGVP